MMLFAAKTATNVIAQPFSIHNMNGKAGIMKLGMSWISWRVYQWVSYCVSLIIIQGQHTQASLQAFSDCHNWNWHSHCCQSWPDHLFRSAVSAGRGCWLCCNTCLYNWWGMGCNRIIISFSMGPWSSQLAGRVVQVTILGTIQYAGIVFLRFGWGCYAMGWIERLYPHQLCCWNCCYHDWRMRGSIWLIVESGIQILQEQCPHLLQTFGIHWGYSQYQNCFQCPSIIVMDPIKYL